MSAGGGEVTLPSEVGASPVSGLAGDGVVTPLPSLRHTKPVDEARLTKSVERSRQAGMAAEPKSPDLQNHEVLSPASGRQDGIILD